MSDPEEDDFLERGPIQHLIKSTSEIKALVSLLKCQICYTLMSSPVMTTTGCSHNFCSMCLRSHLTVQQNCPSCFQELHETQIKPNKVLQEIITLTRMLLPKLVNKKDDSAQNASSIMSPNATQPNTSVFMSSQRPESGVSTQCLPRLNQSQTEASNQEESGPVPKGMVSCPICQINLPSQMINRHLDECLSYGETGIPSSQSVSSTFRPLSLSSKITPPSSKDRSKNPLSLSKNSSVLSKNKPSSSNQESSTKAPVGFTQSSLVRTENDIPKTSSEPVKNKMKPVTKVVYNLLKDGQLRELLKKEGLESKGDRKTLIRRHQKFSIHWNAQCEEDSPLSRAEIIRIVKREEQNLSSILSNGASSSGTQSQVPTTLFSYDRKTDPTIIEQKQKEILKKNGNNFAKIIEDIKKRRQEKLSSVAESVSHSQTQNENQNSDQTRTSPNSLAKSNESLIQSTSKKLPCLENTPSADFRTKLTLSSKLSTSKLAKPVTSSPSTNIVNKSGPSISVVNDGDLEVVVGDNEQSIGKENESFEFDFDADEDFFEKSEKNEKSSSMKQQQDTMFKMSVPVKKLSTKSKVETRKSFKITSDPPREGWKTKKSLFTHVSDKAESINSNHAKKKLILTPSKSEIGPRQGELYVTPKRKTSRELLFEEPKRLRQQVIDSPQKSSTSKIANKSECPICQQEVQITLMSSHVDRCLTTQNKIETRRSKRNTKAAAAKADSDPDLELDSNLLNVTPSIHEELDDMSSPELSRSPLLTSTVKKTKPKS